MKYSCTGQCCERFFLPRSPLELWTQYEDWLIAGMSSELDIDKIAPMVTPLEQEGSGYWYSCKHFDTETRLCKIYESRPNMCRDYPYDSPCRYCGLENEDYQSREVLPEGGVGFDRLKMGG